MFKTRNHLSAAYFPAFVVGALSAPAHAQTSSSDANAEIQVSSAVTKQADLQFGTIVAGPSASTVIVEPFAGNRVVTGSAAAYGGTVSAARFQVDARPLLFYSISLPPAIQMVNINDATKTMTVNNFTLNGAPVRLLPLFSRIGNFQVGGTLNVGANQEPGDYEGNFTVTVNFL